MCFSAGIGRSGSFVALLWLMQLCARGIRPEVRAAVEDLRLHRMWMVQTLVSQHQRPSALVEDILISFTSLTENDVHSKLYHIKSTKTSSNKIDCIKSICFAKWYLSKFPFGINLNTN